MGAGNVCVCCGDWSVVMRHMRVGGGIARSGRKYSNLTMDTGE